MLYYARENAAFHKEMKKHIENVCEMDYVINQVEINAEKDKRLLMFVNVFANTRYSGAIHPEKYIPPDIPSAGKRTFYMRSV